jgi:hypothetical protein
LVILYHQIALRKQKMENRRKLKIKFDKTHPADKSASLPAAGRPPKSGFFLLSSDFSDRYGQAAIAANL